MDQHVLMGNVGGDPEVRFTGGGRQVANFSLAVNRKRRENGALVETTQWFQIEAWGEDADFVLKHIKKGARLIVTGKNMEFSYTDAQGQTQLLKTPRMTYVDMAFVPGNGTGAEASARKSAAAASDVNDMTDDAAEWVSTPVRGAKPPSPPRPAAVTGASARSPRAGTPAAPSKAAAAMWEQLGSDTDTGDEIPF